jgi:hypothetical protein
LTLLTLLLFLLSANCRALVTVPVTQHVGDLVDELAGLMADKPARS